MNINVRLTLAMTLALTGALITAVAKVHAQSVDTYQVEPLSTQVNPNLKYKIDILRPNTNLDNATQDRFRLFDQFRDNKPGWIEVKKDDNIRPIINEVRPSAVDTLQRIQGINH